MRQAVGKARPHPRGVRNGHAWCIWKWSDKATETEGLISNLSEQQDEGQLQCLPWQMSSPTSGEGFSNWGAPSLPMTMIKVLLTPEAQSPLGPQDAGSRASPSSRSLAEPCHQSSEPGGQTYGTPPKQEQTT